MSLFFDAGPRLGSMWFAAVRGLAPEASVLAQAQADASQNGTKVTVCPDPIEAVTDASAFYTDTWVSMGQEDEAESLKKRLAAYQVDERLMAAAASDAVFMHCLPAHRGEEVVDAVIDGPQSLISMKRKIGFMPRRHFYCFDGGRAMG